MGWGRLTLSTVACIDLTTVPGARQSAHVHSSVVLWLRLGAS